MNYISHGEYVDIQREKIVEIASKIIKKEMDVIEGCQTIYGLWFEAELPEGDSWDFFSLIDSDTETFPKGYLREISSKEYLKEQDKKEKEYLASFDEDIRKECQDLIEKYGK